MDEELSFEELFIELFGDLYLEPFRKAGISSDRIPEIPHVLSHIRECLDEEIFAFWVEGYIDLEGPQEDNSELESIPKPETGQLIDLSSRFPPAPLSEVEEEEEENNND